MVKQDPQRRGRRPPHHRADNRSIFARDLAGAMLQQQPQYFERGWLWPVHSVGDRVGQHAATRGWFGFDRPALYKQLSNVRMSFLYGGTQWGPRMRIGGADRGTGLQEPTDDSQLSLGSCQGQHRPAEPASRSFRIGAEAQRLRHASVVTSIHGIYESPDGVVVHNHEVRQERQPVTETWHPLIGQVIDLPQDRCLTRLGLGPGSPLSHRPPTLSAGLLMVRTFDCSFKIVEIIWRLT